jgi:hypothetical protein
MFGVPFVLGDEGLDAAKAVSSTCATHGNGRDLLGT